MFALTALSTQLLRWFRVVHTHKLQRFSRNTTPQDLIGVSSNNGQVRCTLKDGTRKRLVDPDEAVSVVKLKEFDGNIPIVSNFC